MPTDVEYGNDGGQPGPSGRRSRVRWQRLYNPLVIRLLRSPLHGMMSKSTMLITYEGRRTGNVYTLPVNYTRDGDDLLAVGSREHSWWMNLRGGARIRVLVRGRTYEGSARAFEGAEARNGLLTVLRRVPAYRKHWKIEVSPDGQPIDPEALTRLGRENVLVRLSGLVPATGVSR